MRFFKDNVFIVIALLFLTQSTLVYADNSLVGVWVSFAQSRGGIRSVLQYLDNGEVIATMAVILKGNFSLNKDSLKLSVTDSEPCDMNIKLSQNELVLIDLFSYESISLKRTTKYGHVQKGIVGDWIGYGKDKSPVSYSFTEDGKFFYNKPMPGHTKSKYVVKGNKIESFKDGKKKVMDWSIEENRLKLRYDGKEYILLRVTKHENLGEFW